ACWTLSNICAGTPEQISTVLSLNLAQALVERCFDSHEVMKVKIDAAWSLCNVISQGLDAHAEYVIDNHGIPAILCVLSVEMADTRGIVVFLDALQRALTLESRAEFVKEILDEHEFEAMLIALLDHDNYEVHSRAESLAAFFNADTEIETLAPTTNEAGQPGVAVTRTAAMFRDWATERLAGLGFDDEDLITYIVDMIQDQDEDADQEELREALVPFLCQEIEDEDQATEVAIELLTRWQTTGRAEASAAAEAAANEADGTGASALLEIANAYQAKLQLQHAELEKQREEDRERKALAEEEKLRVLQAEAESEDESGGGAVPDGAPDDFTPRPVSGKKMKKQRKAASAAELAVGFENDNHQRVQQKLQAKKEQARDAARAKAERDKQDLAADRNKKAEAKEARRQKAQKGERRR
ncbi:uncharacterized protein MONBRDRAFT_25702, partial [Monosiga brevicollis MX1]